MKIKIAIIIFSLFALTACDFIDQINNTRQTIASQQEEIKTLHQEIEKINFELKIIKNEQLELSITNLINRLEFIAELRPGDNGYSTIKFSLGTLTVSLTDVKPYANGSKVFIKFGNSLATSINGLKAKFEWGKTDEEGRLIENAKKSKEVTFIEKIQAGAWTTVSVVLDDVPPTDLGLVTISEISHEGISLRK